MIYADAEPFVAPVWNKLMARIRPMGRLSYDYAIYTRVEIPALGMVVTHEVYGCSCSVTLHSAKERKYSK